MHDLKFEHLLIAQNRLSPQMGTENVAEFLHQPVSAANQGFALVGKTLLALPFATSVGRLDQFCEDAAAIEVTGTLWKDPKKATPEVHERFLLAKAAASKTMLGPNNEQSGRVLSLGIENITQLLRHDGYAVIELNEAVDATFKSSLVHLYTTLEVFAADLWVRALNLGPPDLALAVCTNRHTKGKPEEKQIKLSELSRYGFDIRQKLGSMLREGEKVSFDSLTKVAKSYRDAFGPMAEPLFETKVNYSADVFILGELRNLIVHRASVVDQRFHDKLTALEPFPATPLSTQPVGQPFLIDATIVERLFNATFLFCVALLKVVNDAVKVPAEGR